MTILVQQLKAEIAALEKRLCICHECGGRGEVHTGEYTDEGQWQPPEPVMVECGECGGDGQIGQVQDLDAVIIERNQLKAENAELIDLMRRVVAEHPRRSHKNDGNGPGHGHAIPGIWDEDNGELAGKPCAWCPIWNAAKGIVERHEQAMTKEQP